MKFSFSFPLNIALENVKYQMGKMTCRMDLYEGAKVRSIEGKFIVRISYIREAKYPGWVQRR